MNISHQSKNKVLDDYFRPINVTYYFSYYLAYCKELLYTCAEISGATFLGTAAEIYLYGTEFAFVTLTWITGLI